MLRNICHSIRLTGGQVAQAKMPVRASVLSAFSCLVFVLLFSMHGMAAEEDAPLNFSFTQQVPGEQILIDDFRLHVSCEGEGDTTVLFEAGLGGSSMEWIPVQQLISGRVRACIYDRAGYAWSDPSPHPSHAHELSREADILLSEIGADGPLLLVGHSFGGFIVRELALRRAENMIGMVLVDTSHEDQLTRLEPLGGKTMMPRGNSSFVVSAVQIPESLPVDLRRKIQAFSRMRKTYAALHSEMQYFRESAEQVRRDRTVVDYPVIVISRGRDLYPLDNLGRQKTAIWEELQADLTGLSTQSTLLIAKDNGHHVHTENPVLIANAIKDILDGTSDD